MSDVSVVIATYGNRSWEQLAAKHALPSVEAQVDPPASAHHYHGPTLHDARNWAAKGATGEWLCFVDPGDELAPRFLESMQASIELFHLDGDWLLYPAVVDGTSRPRLPTERNLIDGNYLPLPTLVRTEQFRRLGGFRHWPAYSDWDLWLRAWLDGAEPFGVPDAAYSSPGPAMGVPSAATREAALRQVRNWHRHDVARRARVAPRRR